MEINAILGGLESALSRGESLQKAMNSFYNAGYEKELIEEAARKFQEIHQRKFEELGVGPYEKKKSVITPVSENKEIKEVKKEEPPKDKLVSFKSEIKEVKKEEKPKKPIFFKNRQRVSKYGEDSLRQSEDLKKALVEAISSIKAIPVYIDQKPKKEQAISDYETMKYPTPIAKAITFLLIFLLVLLGGILGAVIFFKEELIEFFNNFAIQ